MDARSIIIMPSVTEKNNILRNDEKKNCYVFKVDPHATRTQVKKAIIELWNVKVAKVNTANVAGKFKRHGRSQGWRADWKKAFVKLAPGHKIDIFEK
jgi:large subunit ribosomal protein L23